jgi:hypothetical protein
MTTPLPEEHARLDEQLQLVQNHLNLLRPVHARQAVDIDHFYRQISAFRHDLQHCLDEKHDWRTHPANGLVTVAKCARCEITRLTDEWGAKTPTYAIPDGRGGFTTLTCTEEPPCPGGAVNGKPRPQA